MTSAKVQEAYAAKRHGNLSLAFNLFQSLVQEQPSNAEYYCALGEIMLKSLRYDEAITFYQKAANLSSSDATIYYQLGVAYFEKGLLNEWIPCDGCVPAPEELERRSTPLLDHALEIFQQALSIEPDYIDAILQIGRVYSEKKHFPEAIAAYSRVLELDEQRWDARSFMGTAMLMQGADLDEVIPHIEKALSLNPWYIRDYYNLGLALQRKGDYAGAERYFRQAIQGDPTQPNYYCNLGVSLIKQGKIIEALEALHIGLTVQETFPRLLKNLAVCLHQLHLTKAANSVLQLIALLKKTVEAEVPTERK